MVVATKYMPDTPVLRKHFPEPMIVDGDSCTDDHSTSSTILNSSLGELVKTDTQSVLHQQQSRDPDNKLKVRFATQVSYSSDEERCPNNDDLWYTVAEYQLFRKRTLRQAQHVIDTEKCIHTPHSYKRVLHRLYVRHCCNAEPIPVYETIRLQNWMTAAPSRIGLETRCIGVIARDKTLRRKAIVESVKAAQSVNGGDDDDVRMAGAIYSRASVLFAQAIAKGLAGSLEREDKHPRY